MSHFQRLPNSLSHLATLLRTWTRPTILVPIVILCTGGLLLWEVSVDPESISAEEEEEVTDSSPTGEDGEISAEDRLIAAEIDTVPVLTEQLHHSSVSRGLVNSPVSRNKGLFDEVRDLRLESRLKPYSTKTDKALPNSEISTIPVSANSNLLNFNSGASLTPSASRDELIRDSTYSVSSISPFTLNWTETEKVKVESLSVTPLQLAMEQGNKEAREVSFCSGPSSVCPLSSTSNSTFTNSANYVLKTDEDRSLSIQPQPVNSPAISSEPLPGLNPSIPSAVVIPQSNNSYQTNLSGAGMATEIQPVSPAGSNLGVPEYSQVNQTLPPTEPIKTPVSEPRSIPGRYLGDGEIKTFANP